MTTFTALNGERSPKTSEAVNGATNSDRMGTQITNPELRSTEISNSQKDRESREGQPGRSGTTHDKLPFPGATTFADVEGSHKRKRSISDSPGRNRLPSPPARIDKAEGLERAERAEQHGSHRPQSDPQHGQALPQKEAYRSGEGDEGREHDEHWRSQQTREGRTSSFDGPYSAGPVSAQSDEQANGLLRRATSQGEGGEYADYGNQSPDGDDRAMYSGEYTPEQRRDGVIQLDPKKRKRNFSNRTKTGCLTCRRRKKKCDEQKPECLNCVKGSFVCAGYPPQRGTWPKPENKPAQVNIESKDPNYVPPGAYGMPQQPSHSSTQPLPGPPPKRDSLPYNRGQPTLRITPPQGRPLQTDDGRLTASTMASASAISPDNKLSAISAYPTPASSNMYPTPVSAFSDRSALKEYQRVPPLHDLTRTDPAEQKTPAPPPPPPPQSTTLTQSPFSAVIHGRRTDTPPAGQPAVPHQPPSTGVQATAQLALSHTQFPARREKDEMLNGRFYYPFDKELVLERERCSAACWRFNNSTNPTMGVSPAERTRMFREILHPSEGVQLSPSVRSPVTHTGHVGDQVTVEAPFNCDYGYNIQIGNNVSIGRNCFINDSCEVRIGNRVIISPNVCIYTGTCDTHPHRRFGSQNMPKQFGKPIVIEDDVWIGANAIILPGVTVKRGSTVGAGSIVSRDVPPWSILRGEKSSVRRGVTPIEYVG
ncbi:hypothetical protein VTK26DRAFT_5081 [Humicola hyalothermophila]